LGFSASASASNTSLTPYRSTFAGRRKYAKSASVVGVNRSAVESAA